MDKYIGKVLDGRYELLQVIGVGGMAVVYRAHCRLLNRYVAIKILKEEYANDAEFCRRFHNESQAVAMLSHNNIVSVYDVSRNSTLQYIVMELLDGITIKDYLKKKGILPLAEVLYYSIQISKALSHAHMRGIIHQDIKPQNIMLMQDRTIKVMDFGIAKISAKNETKVIKEALGSVHYISPEQAKGNTIDARADIYSFGIVMYEMLTGRLPFEGENPLAIVMQHINAVPLMPSDYNDSLPKSIDKIVMRAMAPSPEKRYQKVDELYFDLEELSQNPEAKFAYDVNALRKEEPKEDLESTKPVNIKEQKPQGEAVKPTPPKKPKKKSANSLSPLLIASIVVLAVFTGAIMFVFDTLFNTGDTERIDVPDFVGKSIEDILLNPEYDNLNIVEDEERTEDSGEEPGTVLEQNPEAGENINSSTEIVLTVAGESEENTSEEIEIPDVTEMSEDRAKLILENAGITFVFEEEFSDDFEEGTVIRTSPKAQEMIDKTERVTVYLSLGQEEKTVEVPNLLGVSKSVAENTLAALGLKVKITEIESEETVGTVIEQSILEGTDINVDTVIELTVSLGKEEEEEPSGDNTDNEGNPEFEEGGETSTEMKSAVMTIALPANSNDVNVKLVAGSRTLYEKTHDSSEGKINVTITGTGSDLVSVYFDGDLWAEEVVVYQ